MNCYRTIISDRVRSDVKLIFSSNINTRVLILLYYSNCQCFIFLKIYETLTSNTFISVYSYINILEHLRNKLVAQPLDDNKAKKRNLSW